MQSNIGTTERILTNEIIPFSSILSPDRLTDIQNGVHVIAEIHFGGYGYYSSQNTTEQWISYLGLL